MVAGLLLLSASTDDGFASERNLHGWWRVDTGAEQEPAASSSQEEVIDEVHPCFPCAGLVRSLRALASSQIML